MKVSSGEVFDRLHFSNKVGMLMLDGDKPYRALKGEAAKLLAHPRVKRVHFNRKKRAFTVGKRTYTGLTRVLADRFPAPLHGEGGSGKWGGGSASGSLCGGLSPIQHGQLVDGQVRSFVSRKRRAGLDPCTQRFVRALRRKGWIPIKAQLPIFSERARVATAIDLLCVDLATDKLILVELKVTNHETPVAYERRVQGKRPIAATMPKVPNSYLNHDLLQLASMTTILAEEYGIHVGKAILMRVGHGAVWLYSLPQWCREHAQTIYGALKRER